MIDLLTALAMPAWAYVVIIGLLTLDVLVPVVPTQAIMITSGALAAYGHLNLVLVIAAGTVGMFTGDALAYLLGRTAGQSGGGNWLAARLAGLRRRFAPRTDDDPDASRTKRAAARFTRGLRRPGPFTLLLCRFVPGGRMAANYHAGRRGYPLRRYVAYAGTAALAWASYGSLVGHVGGTALTHSAWRVFAVAATAAVVFGTTGWLIGFFGADAPDQDDVTAARAASTDGPPRQ